MNKVHTGIDPNFDNVKENYLFNTGGMLLNEFSLSFWSCMQFVSKEKFGVDLVSIDFLTSAING